MNSYQHNKYIQKAIEQAKIAESNGDVPIGAVIVKDNNVIATGYNQVEKNKNSLDHAEIIAIRNAIEHTGYKHLLDCNLYVTIEPCAMCAGAIVLSRIPLLVYGANDPKAGASESLYSITSDNRLNHRCEIVSGIMKDECSSLLSNFFKKIRKGYEK